MKMSGGPGSFKLKAILLIFAVLIAGGTLIYTQHLVQQLQSKERQIVQLYARGLKYIANTASQDGDITFLFDNIIKPIDFPLIMTDADDNVNLFSKEDVRNIEYDTTMSKDKLKEFLKTKVEEMDKVHAPLLVTYQDSTILTKIHYGDSNLITQLRYYPYLQILIAALFIVIGYVAFSSIKKSEQSNIWVGMAKETAHQYGTPISSLMGWLEMLKIHYKDPDKVLDVTEEIGSDVERLNKVTYRFSKIGATPEIKKQSVYELLKKVTDYFQRRLPQIGKGVELTLEGNEDICAQMNGELLEWVIENLIKNALDAIDHKNGKINISFKEGKSMVEIDITDNGKGIDQKRRKDVFRPGYSTKRRGWGLGLSLSKRIVEGYHDGKIFVKNSVVGEGTTFKILLKKC